MARDRRGDVAAGPHEHRDHGPRGERPVGVDLPGEQATIVLVPGGKPQVGTEGRDVVVGTDSPDADGDFGGDDLICLNGGVDIVGGGRGRDRIYGGPRNDTISGNEGCDIVFGQAGDDELSGQEGNDLCHTGVGTDSAPSDPSGRCETQKGIP